jgi:hypothetical protein
VSTILVFAAACGVSVSSPVARAPSAGHEHFYTAVIPGYEGQTQLDVHPASILDR